MKQNKCANIETLQVIRLNWFCRFKSLPQIFEASLMAIGTEVVVVAVATAV
jgi:hypothetical protein